MYTSETHISVGVFVVFGHCHYLLTDPRKSDVVLFLDTVSLLGFHAISRLMVDMYSFGPFLH